MRPLPISPSLAFRSSLLKSPQFPAIDETPCRTDNSFLRKTSPRLFTVRIRIMLEVSNGPSYNSCSMRRVLKTANKPLEIKPQEKSVWICMCGLSKNQPYCDGSHKKVADEEDGKTYEYDSEGHRREVTP